MFTPQLYGQLQTQLSQWITPKDKRHLTVFCKNVAAILQSESGCLSHWLKYLSHRSCKARSQMERLNYFVHNPDVSAETFYIPLLKQFLQAWTGMAMTLTLDTSMLWDEYCFRSLFGLGRPLFRIGSEGYQTWQCDRCICRLLHRVGHSTGSLAPTLPSHAIG